MSAETSGKQIKRRKNSLPLKTKLELLNKLKCGETVASVARFYGVNESSIRTIRKSEEKIRNSADVFSNVIKKVREPVMEKMELALNLWIEDRSQKKVPLSGEIIQEKAKLLYQYFKDDSSKFDFQASDSWFSRFKMRYSLDAIKIVKKEVYTDKAAAERYPEEFLKIIEENEYQPEQVFNVDETVFFWKRLPQKTFISKQNKSMKSVKDKVTMLLCSNAAGYYLIKPMLFYRALEPQEVKNESIENLILHWALNKKPWINSELFSEWFFNYFVPDVEEYLEYIGVEFKVLLILDNAPFHSVELITAHPNIKVVILPRNTSNMLQPIDQGISQAFKLFYLKRMFQFIQYGMDSELDIIHSWRKFGIAKSLEFIEESIDELKQKGLNSYWKNLWPSCVQSENDKVIDASEIMQQIVEIASTIGAEGFDELDIEDIEELLSSYDEDLTEADLAEILSLEKESIVKSVERKPTPVRAELNVKTLAVGIKFSHNLCQHFMDIDPCMERSIIFKMKIEEAMTDYMNEFRKLQSTTDPIKN